MSQLTGLKREMLISLMRDSSGATAIEYALIAAGIGLAIATSVAGVGSALVQAYSTMQGIF